MLDSHPPSAERAWSNGKVRIDADNLFTRRIWLLCVGLLLALPVRSDLAAQSGVLLGLVDTGTTTYRTLWITTTGDSAAVMATGPGILVPRRDGFWHVDLVSACTSFEPSWGGDLDRCDRVVDIVESPEQ